MARPSLSISPTTHADIELSRTNVTAFQYKTLATELRRTAQTMRLHDNAPRRAMSTYIYLLYMNVYTHAHTHTHTHAYMYTRTYSLSLTN